MTSGAPSGFFPGPRSSHGKEGPAPTVDIIIEFGGGIVLVERKFPPHGWALPGGFVDYGETLEEAARREAMEETGLDVELIRQMHTYSDPGRDPRRHTISTVFAAKGKGTLLGADDALRAAVFRREGLPSPIVFDHADILNDYFNGRY